MTSISLARLFDRQPQLRDALTGLLLSSGDQACVCDEQKNVLLGASSGADQADQPILWEGEICGWVTGGASSALLASLIDLFARQEEEKKVLGAELIDRYREVNLLYHLSDLLAASPHPDSIAGVALGEAMRLNKAKAGLILAVPDGNAALTIAAVQGHPYPGVNRGDLFDRVIRTGKADVANGVQGDDYFPAEQGQLISLACAPLKTDTHVQGLIVLVRDQGSSFSAGSIKLLNTIAMQIGPLLEILRLYRQRVEAERIERELLMARQVQQTLMARTPPEIPGWEIKVHYQPARAVGGDFYDFMLLQDGRLVVVTGDVTDKGMPAALIMATTRSVLRGAARRALPPNVALGRSNNILVEEMLPNMFVTCFYAIIELDSGRIQFANAGHNPPCHYVGSDVQELYATGMPLGLMEGMDYEEKEGALQPGESLLLYSDGITEAHDPQREMFGFGRLKSIFCEQDHGQDMIALLLDRYAAFCGAGAEQEDDITLVYIKRK